MDYLVRLTRIPDLWRFVLITVTALACAGATAMLGFWQLGRAAQKQAITAAIEQQQALPPWQAQDVAAQVPLAGQAFSPEQQQRLLHRTVQLQGHWLDEHTLFLDNRQMQGKPGFYVLTPLRLAPPHEDVVLVVQRGWVQRNFLQREALPPVHTASGLVRIEGRLASAPSKMLELASLRATPGGRGADPDGQKSRIRQNVDIDQWAQQSGLPLLAFSLLQTGATAVAEAASGDAAEEGLLRDWPAMNAGVQKHYGYAFQWFGLCVLVVIFYVWYQLVRRFFLRRSLAQDPDSARPAAR